MESRELLAADLGDAATSSGAAYVSASHEAVGPKLGVLRDANASAVANSLANGDASDEDGVVFSPLRVGESGTMTVHVSAALAGAKLSAWIDFNSDGGWNNSDERIALNVAVAEGDNVVTFAVPATVTSGHYYARVRLSTADVANPGGAALDGEVEDYLVPIAHADSGVFGGQQPLSFNDAARVVPVDLDGDGDVDLLTSRISWIQNVNGQFAEEALLLSATGSTLSVTASALAPADVDGDGDMDFFAALASSGGVSWYENNGSERFTRRSLETGFASDAIAAADVDGDGDVDLVTGVNGGVVRWYVNDGQQSFAKVEIAGAPTSVRSLVVDDMDDDGDLDLMTASSGAQGAKWLENDGSQQFTVRDVAANANLRSIATADLDGDGDLDVLAASIGSLGGIVWYENDGSEAFAPQNLDSAPWAASSLTVADLDGDGDLDVAASGTNRTAWYENDGDEGFALRIIAAAGGTHLDVAAADLDGDGRLDLVTTGTGTAPVASYRQLAEFDYGDAPSPYRVYRQDNGGRHVAVGPRLGATRDAEADASRAPAGAEAEDDGVVFGTLTLSEGIGTVTVNVQNAPAGAKLDAWIDFDGDGSWGVEGEQIAGSLAVTEGDNVVSFVIPSWAVAGATYARFRLSSDGGHGTNGVALDGEVEDHAVMIADRPPATGVFGEAQPVSSTSLPYGSEAVVAADVDGDGDIDLVMKAAGVFAWHENLGSAEFVAHSLGFTTVQSESEWVAVGDLDSDGDVDFATFAFMQGKHVLLWAENDGQQNFTRREAAVAFGSDVYDAPSLADMDADGDMDILVASASYGAQILVNDGQQEFTPLLVGNVGFSTFSTTGVVAADVDGDGDLDVVASGRGNGGVNSSNVVWFQNDGHLDFTWRSIERSAYTPFDGYLAEEVAVGDVDGDGDLDVVSASSPWSSGNTESMALSWHEQVDGNAFVDHVIQLGRRYRWISLADFNGDGDLDIVAGSLSYSTTSALDLFENLGGSRFVRRTLAETWYDGLSNAVADMDGDGDLDVVAEGVLSGYRLAWFENHDLVDPDYGDAPAPYSTTRAENGPIHNGVGPRLGASRTSEADGVPSAGADADAGDDGVAFTAIRVGQASASVTVNVRNAPAGAKLDAWIDFNGDGSWYGAGEQIFGSYAVVEGDNVLTFNVPANAVVGGAVARFRLSTAGGLRESGAAIDGEVEDYLLSILPPEAATGEYLVGTPIGSGPGYSNISPAQSIYTADIDGDGDLDYVATSSGAGPNLAWYENLGDGAFLMHAKSLYGAPAALNARPVDLDRDGDVDIVVPISNGLAWFENDGWQKFTYHAPTTAPTATLGLSGVFDLGDVDGDGDLDALAARATASTQSLVVLLNDGQQRFAAGASLTTLSVNASAIRAADVDGDGDIDFAATFEGSNAQGGVAWYENDGAWTFHDVTRNAPTEPSRAGRDVVPIDFDFDGDIDFVASTLASSYQLALEVFRNDGQQNFTRETLATFSSPFTASSSPARADRLQVADLDGDGDYDAVTTLALEVRLYRNEDQGFAQTTIHQFGSTLLVTAAVGDVDGDGRLEILASEGRSSVVRIDDRPFGDYDRNGAVDQADRDLYEATLGQPAVPPGSGADGDRSGTVDAADLAIWEANQGATPTPPVKAADLNQDERIDGADFLIWQRGFGAVTINPGTHWADVDNTTTVDGGDLAVWMRQYGQGLRPAPAAATAAVAAPAIAAAVEAPLVEAFAVEPQATEVEIAEPLAAEAPATFALPKNVVLTPTAESKKPAKATESRRPTWNAVALRDAALASLGATSGPVRSLHAAARLGEIAGRKLQPAAMTPTLIDELLGSDLED